MTTRTIDVTLTVEYEYSSAVVAPRCGLREHEDEPAEIEIVAVAGEDGEHIDLDTFDMGDYLIGCVRKYCACARTAADIEADRGDAEYHRRKEEGR